jgi:AP-3 complex subunit delta-1
VKYIALLALAKIVPTHRHLVAKYQDMIFSSVSDQDFSIRMRSLELLSAMVRRIHSPSLQTEYLAVV